MSCCLASGRFAIGLGLLSVVCAACAPDTPQDNSNNLLAQPSSPVVTSASPNTSAAQTANTAAAPLATPNSPPSLPSVVPPKGARYTIFCYSVAGPGHAEKANEAKTQWAAATGRKDWYVIHQEDQSSLYFGFYRAVSDSKDTKETKRAVDDRAMVQNLKDSIGDMPFSHAMLLPLDSPDPTAEPQWNLVNAKGVWSIEVAAYRGSPDRKQAAVDTVREMRAHGIEAYYYNGEAVSSVCIGAWPKDAIQTNANGDETSNANRGLHTDNQDSSLMVVPENLAKMLPSDSATDRQGTQTKIVQSGNTITDPTMIAVLSNPRFAYHALNGVEDDVVGSDGQPHPRPSFPVAIPRENDLSANAPQNQAPRVNLLGGNDDPSGSSDSNLKSMGR